MKYAYYDIKRFCHEGCRDSYKADRECRIIYPAWKIEGKLVSHDDACDMNDLCPYCLEPVKQVKKPKKVSPKESCVS